MTDELKPCPNPWCSGGSFLSLEPIGVHHHVICLGCGIHSTPRDTPEEARESWNTRPVEDELRAEVERLRGLYEALPECWHCKRKATVRLVNRPTLLCDECSTELGDDSVGTWRREELPWATAVRAVLEETKG